MSRWLSLGLFGKKHKSAPVPVTEPVVVPLLSEGFIAPQTAQQLLQPERRRQLLNLIWEQTSISKERFHQFYLNPIHRYAELVQELPASENHHHAYLGGMLDHGLELIYHGLRLRQSYLLPPGALPEDQAVQAEVWTAGVTYGGLLHDIGKIAVDLQIEYSDGTIWHPWQGVIQHPYRFRYIKGRDYKLHDAAAGLLYTKVLDADILNWLCRYQALWGSLLFLLAGNYEQAGILGEIVGKADRVSTAMNVGANPERVIQAPIQSLQKQLLLGLRHLIQNELKLNQKGAAGWLTQDALWLVSKVVSDKLRAHLLSEGFESVPSKNSALFNELQSHGIIETNPTSGQAIWKALIVEGDWQQEFTFLKVRPSLIWTNEEPPANFSGELTVIFTPETQNSINTNVIHANKVEPDFPRSATATKPEANLSTDDDISNVLSLLDINAIPDDDQPQPDDTQITIPSIQFVPEKPQSVAPVSAEPKKQQTIDLNLEALSSKESGEQFITWLKEKLLTHKLLINDTAAKVHLVEGQLFLVSPGIFQRYCEELPGMDKDSWRKVQRGFEKLKLHKKCQDDLNIWLCTVRGPRKSGSAIKGYLLDASNFFENPPIDNPFLILYK